MIQSFGFLITMSVLSSFCLVLRFTLTLFQPGGASEAPLQLKLNLREILRFNYFFSPTCKFIILIDANEHAIQFFTIFPNDRVFLGILGRQLE